MKGIHILSSNVFHAIIVLAQWSRIEYSTDNTEEYKSIDIFQGYTYTRIWCISFLYMFYHTRCWFKGREINSDLVWTLLTMIYTNNNPVFLLDIRKHKQKNREKLTMSLSVIGKARGSVCLVVIPKVDPKTLDQMDHLSPSMFILEGRECYTAPASEGLPLLRHIKVSFNTL